MTSIFWIIAGLGLLAFGVQQAIAGPGTPDQVLNGLVMGAGLGCVLTVLGAISFKRAFKSASAYAVTNAMIGYFGLMLMGAAVIGIAAFTWKAPEGGLAFDRWVALGTFLGPAFFGFAWKVFFVEAHAAKEREAKQKASAAASSESSEAASETAQSEA